MKEEIILKITQEMLPHLDNAQLLQLKKVLEYSFVEISQKHILKKTKILKTA